MNGKFIYFIGLLALLCWLPDSPSFSGETASIMVSAYVLPAVGFEENIDVYPDSDIDPDWLLRCPPSGGIICRIQTDNAISDYYYNNKDNSQIALPVDAWHALADICIVTVIYSEN